MKNTKNNNSESHSELLDFLCKNVPEAVFFKDANREYTFLNSEAAKLIGLPVNKIVGKTPEQLFSRKAAKAIRKVDDLNFAGKKVDHIEKIILNKKEQYLNTSQIPVKDKKGKIIGIVGVVRDVTAEQKTKERLLESEEKYSKLVERANDGIILIQKGKLVFINQKCSEMLGYSVKEAMNKPFIKYIHPDERKRILKIYRTRLMGKKVPSLYESVLLSKSGKKINVEINAGIIKYRDGFADLIFIRDITDRKKIERKLIESEARYRNLVENIRDFIFVIDKDLKVISVNEASVRLFRKKDEKEIIGKKISGLFPKRMSEEYGKTLRMVFRTGKKYLSDSDMVVGGKEFWISTSLSPIKDEKGKVNYVVGVARDITEKKKVEEQLRESEEKYKLIYDTSPYSIMTIEPPSWKFTSGNKAVTKMFGIKNEKQLLSLGPWQVSPKYQPDGQLSSVKAKKMISKAMREGRNFFEWTHKKLNGEEFFATVLLNKVNFRGKVFLNARVQDITESRMMEKAIRDSESKLKAILGNMPSGVFVIDKQKKIILFNKSASDIIGISEKEALGKKYDTVIKFISEKTEKRNGKFVVESIKNKETVYGAPDLALITKDKKKVSLNCIASPLAKEGKGKDSTIVVIHDVTKEREIDKIKTEFVSLASHQLKTPLTGIKWFSELLLKDKSEGLSNQQKDFIKQIFDSNERLIKLVSDLLDVSHIDTGRKFDIVLAKTDIIKVLYDVLKEKRNQLKKKNITFIKCQDAPQKLYLFVDKDKIRQVFSNLVDNAVKYSKKGGTVRMGCNREEKGKVIVYISDEGIGIPKNVQKKIFTKFFRADNAVLSEADGTGLGLYIAKAIVNAHGGDMWFKSKAGKGTTFYFSLPINNK